MALILYYFKVDVMQSSNPIDETARLWNYIIYLSKNNVLPIAQIPIEFK